MNLQQFLAEEPIDKLFQQFFSIEGQSQKSKSQQTMLINSIVLYVASNQTFTFKNLYEECQYQLEVNNQQRDAINKMCRLLCGVIGKAPYLLKNVQVKFFVDEVLQFLLSKVFVTVCSADCIRCLWALVNAFTTAYPLAGQESIAKKGCCSVEKSSCCGSTEMKDENSNCCGGNSSTQQPSSGCCSVPTQPQTQPQTTSSLITKHEQVCKSIVSRFLNTFKLHVKAYPFKVRKDIYKLIYYVLRFTRFSQQHFLKSFSQHERYEMENFDSVESQPLFVEIGITKQQLIETTIKNLSDEKDPRNMQLIFQNYIILISLFAQQICTFNYRQQLFENIEVYYPLSMQGDQSGFQIDQEDRFSQFQLKSLLDQCLLQDIFCNQVRELLVEKMSAPPINDYVSLYVNYITKFNPMLWKSKLVNMKLHSEKYIVLTVNLLQKLCQEEYLDESYTVQQASSSGGGCCGDSPADSCCGGNKAKSHQVEFSISQLIATIIKNVFISPMEKNTFSIYSLQIEQRFVQFLNSLIVSKLFNTTENHKHAGTIIDIVKTILNSEVVAKNVTEIKSTKASKAPKQSGCCSSNSNNDSCCSNSNEKASSCSSSPCQPQTSQNSLKQPFGKSVNFEQMLTNYVILKFMQYWSGKGDLAFKLGLLIISLNKKLESVSIQQFYSSNVDESTQNLMEHLLITLGNVYEAYLQTDQVKIMVLKTLMTVSSIYNKLYENNPLKRQKSIIKVTKVNNGIIHKDCIKLSEFLSRPATQNQQKNSFDRSQQPILKSYVDYIMEMYVTAQKEHISEETVKIVNNIFGSLTDVKNQTITNEQSNLDVKLYGMVRYLSIVGYEKLSQTVVSQKLSHAFISILLTPNKQINSKLTVLLKYYNYPTIISLLGQLFSQIKSFDIELSKLNEERLESFFINLSLNGKVLKDKFMEYHVVELEAGISVLDLVANDLLELRQQNDSGDLSKLLIWYMLKNLWRGTLSSSNGQSQVNLLSKLFENANSIDQKSIVSLIIKQTTARLSAFLNLYSNSTKIQSLTFHTSYSDLQCTLLYVKYLKSKNQQSTIRFNSRLGQLYDSGMVEYFWNRLFKSMTYEEKTMISVQKKTELVGLLEYLPQKILVNYAGQVAPLVIYTTKTNEKMEEQKDSNQQTQKDQFDFSMSKLISKLCPTLPEQSLITYVVPYCLSYLKIAAINCQNGTQIPSDIIPASQTINVLLNMSKVVGILIQKSQEKSQQKVFKNEKLRKSVVQTHKKDFRQYYGRLIYHKKRLIRQSSRYLLSLFE